MRLDDEVIAHIAKLLQMAILTGTDVIDHLRMIQIDTTGTVATLTDVYRAQAEDNVTRMLNEAIELTDPEQ